MRSQSSRARNAKKRIRFYTAWVKQLRAGKAPPDLHLGSNDPLAQLGLELKKLAEILTQREQEFQRLLDLMHAIEQGISAGDILDRIFEAFKGLIPYERIDCAFMSDDGSRLTAYWGRSLLGPIQVLADHSQPMAGSSLLGVLHTGEPHILNDLEEYIKNKPSSNAAKRIVLEGGRSSLTCPLIVARRPIGFLFFTSNNKNSYQEVHRAIFQQIASQVSTVIDKSRNYEKIIELNQQLARESEQFEEAASRDPLTAILNRGAIIAALANAIKARATGGGGVGLIMADIDHFKNINDTLGHPAGDAALIEFTRRVASGLRPGDLLGRYGGEEFLIIIPNTTLEITMNIAERLLRSVGATPFKLGTNERAITASFGVAVSVGPDAMAQDIVAAADRALYAAKSGGRNRVVVA